MLLINNKYEVKKFEIYKNNSFQIFNLNFFLRAKKVLLRKIERLLFILNYMGRSLTCRIFYPLFFFYEVKNSEQIYRKVHATGLIFI